MKAALHVVNLDTNFNAAMYVNEQTIESVWDAFVTFLAELYVVFSMKMRVDQGSAFASVR